MSNTFLEKKQLKGGILLILLGILLLGSVPLFVYALFEDNFEECSLGDLNGQCGWSGFNGIIVNDDKVFDGEKSIRGNGGQDIKLGTLAFSDYLAIRVWFNDNFVSASHQVIFGIFKCCHTPYQYWNLTGNKLCKNADCSTPNILFEDIEPNEWHTIYLEWENIEDQWKIKAELDNLKGIWYDADVHWTEGIDELWIQTAGCSNDIWLDTIEKIQRLLGCTDECFYCEYYDACIDAGCWWVYSLYYLQIDPKMTGWYCTEPYEPEEEECGEMFKCQFCMSEETCGENVSCEWVNRGLGDRCYLKEPTIPPAQAGWEVPELENCEELSGVEKWLCEIKNFIAGIFMPSQEKINALYNTFGAFKERFPFNYAGAISNFFSDIKDSLATEKEIPVKILGQESNVSFAFFDKTTTIGGQVETFKNIWLDFTSLIIILAWSVWLIGFIKRFFA